MPTYGFGLLDLAEAPEQANPAPVRIKPIHILNDDEPVAVGEEPDIPGFQ